MRTVLGFLLSATLLASAFSATAAAQDRPKRELIVNEEAQKAAEAWLSLLDQEKYEDSYKTASNFFRQQVKLEQWVSAAKDQRSGTGPTLNRKVGRLDLTKTMRNGPDGEYAVYHFVTNYRFKTEITERLTLVMEDGHWQVFAYGIH